MALYNNGFPVTYPYLQTPPPVMQPQASPLIWVQGEAGAKAYQVAPNTTVPLFDTESQVVYLKSTDITGMPSIKTLDYTIRGAVAPVAAQMVTGPDYATRADFEALRKQVEELASKMKEAETHE